tara:strand:- start:200258 stop:200782 length:525 start_codon:yes stop_codon:yes gene_type:complete
MNEINWISFPLNSSPSDMGLKIIKVFNNSIEDIRSPENTLKSDEVLKILRKDLEKLNFKVECGKKTTQKVTVPVLFGQQGKVIKSFEADAYNESLGYVIEVEAGRGVRNHQFLKDLFQACLMKDTNELCIAVRNIYESSNAKYRDFNSVKTFFETLYTSNRLQLPLKRILIIGY